MLSSLIAHVRFASRDQTQSELVRDWLVVPTRFPSLVRALETISIHVFKSDLKLQELLLRCLQFFPEQCSSLKVLLPSFLLKFVI